MCPFAWPVYTLVMYIICIYRCYEKCTPPKLELKTYFLLLQERLKCKHAIKSIVVKACLNSSCVNSSETVFLLANNMTRVMSTYTNLQENKKYALLLHVLYNGGVVQRSQLVEISECILFFLLIIIFLIFIQVHLMSGTFQLSQ